ncbi:hypothetical protein MUK42_37575 [Musa troglodytarum]|uniref:Uncharacterized protein n=1 Tax=Musa troglodytarum TaxID=320322 RepID=A0A9E7GHN2_9LILI|nr:hypothetical protein MUK42_37575 [Musa troglodytarum]URE15676.1 hypothetical protein MUK42_37575 [Musa troglodytarum]
MAASHEGSDMACTASSATIRVGNRIIDPSSVVKLGASQGVQRKSEEPDGERRGVRAAGRDKAMRSIPCSFSDLDSIPVGFINAFSPMVPGLASSS